MFPIFSHSDHQAPAVKLHTVMEQNVISQVIRTRRRSLALQIAPDASLIVRAPLRASEASIRDLVNRKMRWILKHQRLVREHSRPPVKYAEGEKFLYLGEWRTLRVVAGANAPLVLNEKEFRLSGECLPRARQLLEAWYREKALEIISERVKPFVEMSGLNYGRLSITGAKRRWGSCSLKGNLNFSWRLIMGPPAVVDYVIAHELAHLEEHNHSSSFWRKVAALYPDCRPARKWLRKNQHLLARH